MHLAITLTAIVAISVLQALAIIKGIDGSTWAIVASIIAGLAGYHAKSIIDKRKH